MPCLISVILLILVFNIFLQTLVYGTWFAQKKIVETCKPTLFTFTFCYHVVQNRGSLGTHMGTQILVVLLNITKVRSHV